AGRRHHTGIHRDRRRREGPDARPDDPVHARLRRAGPGNRASAPRPPQRDRRPGRHLLRPRLTTLGAMTERLSPGDAAPDFTLPDAEGNDVSLSDFRGQSVVVYFYPAAGTPGCTKQACDFRDNLDELNAAGYQVLGISPDK